MKYYVLAFAAGILFSLAGCKSGDLPALAREFATAMKAGDEDTCDEIGNRVARMSKADQVRFNELVAKELFGDLGEFGEMIDGQVERDLQQDFDKIKLEK